jgi:hypothetical protein
MGEVPSPCAGGAVVAVAAELDMGVSGERVLSGNSASTAALPQRAVNAAEAVIIADAIAAFESSLR